jgi:hypothetical protein
LFVLVEFHQDESCKGKEVKKRVYAGVLADGVGYGTGAFGLFLSGADLTGRIFPSGCVFILLLLWGKQGNKSYFSLMFDNFEANNW